MSSDEDFNEPGKAGVASQPELKKRRLQRACDICRRKKVRCDGPQMPGNKCTNCSTCNFQCTYVEAAKKRGPPKGYVEALENRLDKLQKLLHRFVPDLDFTKELDDTSGESHSFAAKTMDSYHNPNNRSPTAIATGAIQKSGSMTYEGDEEWDAHIILPDSLSRLDISGTPRFFGKSSGAMLVQTAINLRTEYGEGDHQLSKLPRPLDFIREEYWKPGSWESILAKDPPINYEFPEADLITHLVDLYFTEVNIFTPFLHRPTFEKDVTEQKHLKDPDFASILLLVCATASRYSDDPRALLEPGKLQSAGWQWFHQVQGVRKSLLKPAHLADLQYHCLSALFLLSSSSPQACWTMVGVGIRLAQEVGAHRRSTRHHPWSIEDELWKRAFWALISIDRQISAALGRPCATQDEDFDIELPIECDDEYMETNEAEEQYKQPSEKPSVVAFFVSYLKLLQILNMALRTIYCINKSRIILGFVGPQWEQHMVSELDSALNKWFDSIPDHLRWDPNREDRTFYAQSMKLYISYYHLQILIHRPFVSSKKLTPLSFPSLAICTNAARACAHIVDLNKIYPCLMSELQLPMFTAGIIALLSIFAGRRSGLITDPAKEMADVLKCMEVLKACEPRWQVAGRLWDILYEVASVSELASAPASQKRERDSDSPKPPASDGSSPDDPSVPGPAVSSDGGARSYAGDKRAASLRKRAGPASYPTPPPQPQTTEVYHYPLHSNGLGQVPVHSQHAQHEEYWYPPSNPQLSNGSASFEALSYPTVTPLNRQEVQQPLPRAHHSQHSFSAPVTSQWTQPLTPYSASTQEYYRGAPANVPTTQPHVSPTFNAGYYSRHSTGTNSFADQDMVTMWTCTPTGYGGLEDWGTYLNNVSEMAQQNRFSGNPDQHRQ